MTTVPPIIANVPAPMEISAISRMISRTEMNGRVRHPAQRPHVEQHVVADAAQDVGRPLELPGQPRIRRPQNRHSAH